MTAIHAVDLDSPELRTILIGAAVYGSSDHGRLGMMAERRAAAVVDEVLRTIRQTCEDLEPTLAQLRANTTRATMAAQHSAGRRAALEHALGVERAIRGEVLPRD